MVKQYACKVRSNTNEIKFLKRDGHNAIGVINDLLDKPFIAEILSVKEMTQVGLDQLISFSQANAY